MYSLGWKLVYFVRNTFAVVKSINFYVHVKNRQQKDETSGHSDESMLFTVAEDILIKNKQKVAGCATFGSCQCSSSLKNRICNNTEQNNCNKIFHEVSHYTACYLVDSGGCISG